MATVTLLHEAREQLSELPRVIMGIKTRTTSRHQGEGNKNPSHRLRAAVARRRSQRPRLFEDIDPDLPPLPPADDAGQYPAVETARAIIARQIITARKKIGWTQAELAARAGVRQATLSRIETGKHSPALKTMAKIDRALKEGGG